MSTESFPLPSTYTFGKVIGRVIYAIADTADDADDKPEARPATGKVTFTPKIVNGRTPNGADYSSLVVLAPVQALINATGQIIDAEGRIGIWLVTGVWTVKFELAGASIPSFDINVTTAYTSGSPLDLAQALPYTPPENVVVQDLVVPSGAQEGQALVWNGELEWAGVPLSESVGSIQAASSEPTAPANDGKFHLWFNVNGVTP